MLRFNKSYLVPNTFPSRTKDQQGLECVEMDSELPFYAASIQMEDGRIRWLLLAAPNALVRAHEGLVNGAGAITVYELKPDFEDGIELRVRQVTKWDAMVRIVTDEQPQVDVYRIACEALMPNES